MQTYTKTQQIDRTVGYSVKEIITPVDQLECWTGEEERREELIKKATENDYTYIPVKKGEAIAGLITLTNLRKKVSEQPITSDWLIAADTPILQLFDLFAKQDHKQRRNFLVLQSSRIVGLVSPADLNQIPARASVYLLVAHFEQSLANLIRNVLKDGESSYIGYISSVHRSEAQKLQAKNKKADIKLDLLNYLYLTDLVSIVSRNKDLREIFKFGDQKTVEQALNFKVVRNPVSHVTNVFIEERSKISAVNDACERLIKYGAVIQNYFAQK